MKKPPKSVTPTTLNRPVKDGELLIEKEASSASAQAGTDLFAVASKPRPNFVSESDHREELDFELGEKFLFLLNKLKYKKMANATIRIMADRWRMIRRIRTMIQ